MQAHYFLPHSVENEWFHFALQFPFLLLQWFLLPSPSLCDMFTSYIPSGMEQYSSIHNIPGMLHAVSGQRRGQNVLVHFRWHFLYISFFFFFLPQYDITLSWLIILQILELCLLSLVHCIYFLRPLFRPIHFEVSLIFYFPTFRHML